MSRHHTHLQYHREMFPPFSCMCHCQRYIISSIIFEDLSTVPCRCRLHFQLSQLPVDLKFAVVLAYFSHQFRDLLSLNMSIGGIVIYRKASQQFLQSIDKPVLQLLTYVKAIINWRRYRFIFKPCRSTHLSILYLIYFACQFHVPILSFLNEKYREYSSLRTFIKERLEALYVTFKNMNTI